MCALAKKKKKRQRNRITAIKHWNFLPCRSQNVHDQVYSLVAEDNLDPPQNRGPDFQRHDYGKDCISFAFISKWNMHFIKRNVIMCLCTLVKQKRPPRSSLQPVHTWSRVTWQEAQKPSSPKRRNRIWLKTWQTKDLLLLIPVT